MIDKNVEIVAGLVVTHDEDGIHYHVDRLIEDATGWEKTRQLGTAVLYTQLEAKSRPAGTEYVRGIDDFRKEFSIEELDDSAGN